ncbi:hypothetical protein K0M31_007204 [Melipona bicolor]|uniref:Uncharacterized protein n=1 Tax=Melipona bicolor TaxID=60889 RepID=A0AA40GAY7_9HYME|nr:hypothetical protein K0M31_007204 [Melipona bicolor]
MKSRLPTQSSTASYPDRKEAEATEMAAEETSFYSSVTTTSGTTKVAANEIPTVEREEAVSTSLPIPAGSNTEERGEAEPVASEKPAEPVPLGTSTDNSVNDSQPKGASVTVAEQYSTTKLEETTTQSEGKVAETTTARFEIRSEDEELFAKASQSVADLTSSASALYDKPGMFKAVSPESRVVVPHFKIPTDEPTLPIEAFFQELSKKS